MALDLSADSIVLSRIPYRYSRVGNLPYIVYFSGCLAALAILLVVAGATLTAIVFTEVRPPTADENYNRFIGADFRRVVGPLMMVMAALMLILGCGMTCFGYQSARTDRQELEKFEEKSTELQPFQVNP
ncbi:hypothetical protein BIW11_01041 [Tropilaelaps mercedesae]|uniref:Transmembrane protein-like n=1 Tax=Tropilaelaps mercedesae TaxID=418985 RepID=A0A1V9XKW5_9ACAR|nr:hypothetical protein BIW11_01041 [Tropilaelaps mercedesae]